MSDTKQNAMTPAEIAARLTAAQRQILQAACVPLREQRSFPGLLSNDRAALVRQGLVRSFGYPIQATPLGLAVRAIIEKGGER
jgi:hypothetical protein